MDFFGLTHPNEILNGKITLKRVNKPLKTKHHSKLSVLLDVTIKERTEHSTINIDAELFF